MRYRTMCFGLAVSLLAVAARAEVKVTVDHHESGDADASFKFKNVPPPGKENISTNIAITIIDGTQDENGGTTKKLIDGKLPTGEDQPEENFFFNQGEDGGRLLFDLGSAVSVAQLNTYSWHTDTRAAQVYKLYASDGSAADFKAKLTRPADPEKNGWKLIAKVDTRPKSGAPGGQYGVSISDPDGELGNFRYLLFDVSQTESDDAFGNTFYSEINVIGKK